MTEFKVGDKVRVTNNTDKNGSFIGEVGTVTTSLYAGPFDVTVSFDGYDDRYFFAPSGLELVEGVQVGDKVRVTQTFTREFVVNHIDPDDGSIRGKRFGESFYADNPAYTLEVVEKAKPKFEVGQVLTEVEELEALPVGAVVSREWPESTRPPRAWTKTEAGEFHNPGMAWDRDVKTFGHPFGQKIITVVWLP